MPPTAALSVAWEARPLPAALHVALCLRSPSPWTQAPAVCSVPTSALPWLCSHPPCPRARRPPENGVRAGWHRHAPCSFPLQSSLWAPCSVQVARPCRCGRQHVHSALSVSIPGSVTWGWAFLSLKAAWFPRGHTPVRFVHSPAGHVGHFHVFAVVTLPWALAHWFPVDTLGVSSGTCGGLEVWATCWLMHCRPRLPPPASERRWEEACSPCTCLPPLSSLLDSRCPVG